MKVLLPIGSVVKLKEGTKSVMIIGILQEDAEGNNYDYISCLFPEGYIDEETFYLFNHDDIEIVESMGYVNSQTKEFFAQLNEYDIRSVF